MDQQPKSSYLHELHQSDTLIISFASYNRLFGGIRRFEFLNFLNTHFADVDKKFYIDDFSDLYHKGIAGISKNIDETVEYFKKEIEGYKHVVMIGVSCGGYAAILFGSLLNVSSVVAFVPQTVRIKKDVDEKYRDIQPYINDSTVYTIYGDTSIQNVNDVHHIRHCERIADFPNVRIIKKEGMDIRKMRDNGELYDILTSCLQNRVDIV
jgi:hypothetical protein